MTVFTVTEGNLVQFTLHIDLYSESKGFCVQVTSKRKYFQLFKQPESKVFVCKSLKKKKVVPAFTRQVRKLEQSSTFHNGFSYGDLAKSVHIGSLGIVH